jgi:hypothetical protein
VPSAAIAADFSQPFDIHGDFTPQVAFNGVTVFDRIPDFGNLLVIQVLDAGIVINRASTQNFIGKRPADSKNIAKRNLYALFIGQIHSGNTCHQFAPPLLYSLRQYIFKHECRNNIDP